MGTGQVAGGVERGLGCGQEAGGELARDGGLSPPYQRPSSKSDFVEALQHALGRWTPLIQSNIDGRLAIDNNAADPALRGTAAACKNFLFFDSDRDGGRAAIYSLIETAKLSGVDPET